MWDQSISATPSRTESTNSPYKRTQIETAPEKGVRIELATDAAHQINNKSIHFLVGDGDGVAFGADAP